MGRNFYAPRNIWERMILLRSVPFNDDRWTVSHTFLLIICDSSFNMTVIASSVACKLALARLCSNMLVPVLSLRVAVD